ncbi:MAG: YDG domain-containing protein [Flavobacterium sp.]|nr:YDG domain-containing protein [Flavobacterium sp.]
MKNNLLFKRSALNLFLCVAFLCLIVSGKSFGQVAITSGNLTYSQNFDGLPATSATSIVWTNNSTITGWYLYNGANAAITSYSAETGSTGNFTYNSYGATSGNTERSLGSFASGGTYWGSPGSGAAAGYLAFSVTNTTGSTVNSATINFDGEQWRNGGNANAQTLTVQYGFGATFASVSTWNSTASSFTFTTPVATATAAAVVGNVAGKVANLGGTLSSLNWTNATTLWIRWIDLNDSGNDHAVGIDNFSITAAAPAVNPTFNNFSNVTKNYGDANGFTMIASSDSTGAITYSSANTAVATINNSGVVTIKGVGNTTITANQAAAAGYNAGSASATLTINSAATGLTITANGVSKTYGATLTNGSSVNFTVSGLLYTDSLGTGATVFNSYGTGAAANTSATLSTVSPAVYTGSITPSAVTNGSGATYNASNYATVSYISGTITVNKANQSIVFASTNTKIYGTADYAPGASSVTSGINAITYSSNNTAVADIISGNIHIVGVGTATITASQISNDNYNATSATQTLTVTAKSLSITGLTANNKSYDGNTNATLSGTAALSGIVSGDEANVILTGTPVAAFTSSAVGTNIPVNVTGYSLTGLAAGNYFLLQPTVLAADIIATTPTIFISGALASLNTTYGIASAATSFSLSGQSLTEGILVTAPSGFEVSLTSNSGYATSITVGGAGNVSATTVYVRLSATTTVGSYSGNVAMTSNGATTITIATANSSVAQKTLTITGLIGVDKTYDATAAASVTGTATLDGIVGTDDVNLGGSAPSYTFANANAGTNKPITASGYTLTGTATVNYSLTQPIGLTATINKADQIINGIALTESKFFGDAAYSVATTATSGLTVTYSSSSPGVATVSASGIVTIVGAGTTTITASQSGNGNYNAATGLTQSLTVGKANQTLSALTSLVTKTYGDAPYSAVSTATSGLTVSYLTSNPAVATVAANGTVTIVGVGTTVITASQTGNSNYNAAANATQSLTVNKADQTITFNVLTDKTTADGTFSLPLNASSGLPISYTSSNTAVATISGNTVTIVGSGATTITASQSGNENYNAAPVISQVQVVLTSVAKWTFEGVTTTNTGANATVTGSALADQGSQTAGSLFSATHANAATVWSNAAGNASSKSVTSEHWGVGDYYQFKVNTSNYHSIAISLDQTGSNTGPSTFKIQYSLNGTAFTDFGSSYTITNDSWSNTGSPKTVSVKSFDLSTISGLNNKSSIYLRVVNVNTTSINNGTVATGGTSRIDNFLVTGISCDTPATIMTSGPTTFCSGGNVTLTASAGVSYLWSNGATTPSIIATTSGNYSVTITSDNGCTATSTATTVTVTTNTSNTTTASACDTYHWLVNNQDYTTSGTYNVVTGCHTETLVLTITPSTTNTTTVSACDSYLWAVGNGNTYAESGNYTFVNGCHTETLALTITPTTSHTTTVAVCDSYTWTAGNSNTYTQSGNYIYLNGCHTETLALTINTNTITTQPSNALICKATGAAVSLSVVSGSSTATYQWYSQLPTDNTTWTLLTANENYAGVTSSILNITKTDPIIPETGTKYKVVIISDCGSITSNAVIITDVILPIPGSLILTDDNATAPATPTTPITAVGIYVGTDTALKLTAAPVNNSNLLYKWILPVGVTSSSTDTGTGLTITPGNIIYVKFLATTATTPLVIYVQTINSLGCNSSLKPSAVFNRLVPVAPALTMNNGTDATAIYNFSAYMGTNTVLRLSVTPTASTTSYEWELPIGINRVTALNGGTITASTSSTEPFIFVNFSGVTSLNTYSYTTTGGVLTYALRIGVKSKNGVGTSVTNNNTLSNPTTTSTAKLITLTAVVPVPPATLTLNNGITADPITVISKLIGQQGTYRLSATTSVLATSYFWELPSGVTRMTAINGGTTTNSTTSAEPFIYVKFTDNVALPYLQFGVKAVNSVGNSASNNAALTPATASTAKLLRLNITVPIAPAPLTLNDGITTTAITTISKFIGQQGTYRLSAGISALANSYLWELPAGVVRVTALNNGTIDTSDSSIDPFIFVKFTENVSAPFMQFGVKAANGVGSSVTNNATLVPLTTSTAKILRLNTTVPAAPATLTLTDFGTVLTIVSKYVGKPTTLKLTAAVSPLANSYSWELPAGVTRTDENGLTVAGLTSVDPFIYINLVSVSVTSSATVSFIFGVKAINGIGTSATVNAAPNAVSTAKLLTVTAGLPGGISILNGTFSVCNRAAGYDYSVSAPVGANYYSITAPAGSIVTSAAFPFNMSNALITPDTNFNIQYSGTAAFSLSDKSLVIKSGNAFGLSASKTVILTKITCPTDLPRMAVDLLSDVFEVVAYPNPFTSALQLNFKTASEDQIEVKVYDMVGKLIEIYQSSTSEMKNQKMGDNYPSGIYNIIVKQGGNQKTLRVIKK